VTEHTVGHVTFERTLRDAVAADGSIDPTWIPLAFPPRGPLEGLPPLRSNWSLRASLRARARLAGHAASWDGLLFHTQTASLSSVGLMRRHPTVISIDATPRNYDEVGEGYAHAVADRRVEAIKARIVGRALRSAAGVVAWSDWVRRSLVADYGVADERIELIPAGTRIPPGVPERERDGPPRLLFVGGQFERKGGDVLLEALASLDVPHELHVVTQSPIGVDGGVHVHRDIRPGSPRLDELYAAADVFVLPTSADASPHVVLEAMAAGLPVVSTPVGAIPEMVGDTGMLVPPREPRPLRAALEGLLTDASRRRSMGAAARARAERHFDSGKNADRVLALMKRLASAR
jgi:glycosyltransferase involved in cell wall biosynthesis